jgi:hypothetical protein
MRRFIPLLLVSLLIPALAGANVPDPALSTVPNVIMTPQGTIPYVVNVVGSQGPVDAALVEVVFTAAADPLICWCPGQVHPTITALTDPAGDAVFVIEGGLCMDPSRLGGTAVEVFANGIKLAEVGSVSPDAVDAAGLLSTGGGVIGPPCSVGLSDATFHTPSISSGLYEFCTDINSDLLVDLTDAVILTPPISGGDTCP